MKKQGMAMDMGMSMSGGGGVSYLLRDEFTTDRAAGAVHGTVAEPGPGTRVVVDTGSKLSISGGLLTFASGGAWSDPMIALDAVTRTAGRFLVAEFTQPTAGEAGALGFGASQAAYPSGNGALRISWTTGGFIVFETGSPNVGGGAVSGTSYKFFHVLKATGSYGLIKGGVYTYPTLLWFGGASTTTPLYPVVAVYAIALTSAYGRVPTATWLPTPLAYSTFTGSNGAALNFDATGPDGQAYTAPSWTGATWDIQTNAARNTPTEGADIIVDGAMTDTANWTEGAGWAVAAGVATATAASSDNTAAIAPLTIGTWYKTVYTTSAMTAGSVNLKIGTAANPVRATNATWTETNRATSTAFAITATAGTGVVDDVSAKALTLSTLFASLASSTADVLASVDLTLPANKGTQAGIVVNLDNAATPANFIIAYHDGTNAHLDECVAGTYTSKINAAATYGAGYTLVLVREGTEARLYYNNTLIGAQQTMTANTNTTHGLFSTSALNSSDKFTVFPRGTGGEFSQLDSY